MSRAQDVLDARAAADEWAVAHGLPASGGYSGPWYVDGYLGGWWPDGWLKWWAHYGVPAGSLIGGDVVAHQYGSDPIDLDVMSDTEITTPQAPGGEEPPPVAECDTYKAAIETAVNRLQIELDRKTAAGKTATLRRTLIKEIQSELFGALTTP